MTSLDQLPPWPQHATGTATNMDYDADLIAALRARLEFACDELGHSASRAELCQHLREAAWQREVIAACREPKR